jgi:hypothetical protein
VALQDAAESKTSVDAHALSTVKARLEKMEKETNATEKEYRATIKSLKAENRGKDTALEDLRQQVS